MKSFVIKKVNKDGYNRFLILLSSDSLIDHLSDIKKDPYIVAGSGKILIDQLLITGDGNNRFICCDFKNGELNFKTAHIVSPINYFREQTCQWLSNNYQYIEYSILTTSQRDYIKNHCISKGK